MRHLEKLAFTLGITLLAGCGSRGATEQASGEPDEAVGQEEAIVEEAEPGDVLLVVNKGEASVSVVDPHAREVIATIGVGEGPHEVAASPDGALAVVTNYGTRDAPGSSITVIDIRERAAIRTIDLGEHTRPHGVAWLPDGREVLVTTEGSKHLLCVDPRDEAITCEIGTEQEVSHMVAVTPDGSRAFVANIGSGSVTVIDLIGRTKLDDVITGAGAEGVAVSPDGREVWVTNRGDDTVSVLDAESLEIRETFASSSFPIRAHITADGAAVLVTNARSGTLSVFSREGGEPREVAEMGVETPEPDPERVLGNFEGTTLPIGVVTSGDGARAFVAHALADRVSILDLESLETIATVEVGQEPDGMAYVSAAAESSP
jgi:YVTN family beta-propeller protein